MELEGADTSVRVDSGVLNKLMSLAGELLVARDQFRAVCERTLVPAEVPPPAAVGTRATLVLFGTPDQGRMAIPLAQVDRIEEFDSSAVYFEGRQCVVRYRGKLLPLVEVSSVLPERRARRRRGDEISVHKGRMQVVIYSSQGRSVGLVVDRLLDVFEERLVLEQPGSRSGARASVVVRDRVTELVDVEAMLQSIEPSFYERQSG
jgi:two-component system chemotaxis sensor kinase CheA